MTDRPGRLDPHTPAPTPLQRARVEKRLFERLAQDEPPARAPFVERGRPRRGVLLAGGAGLAGAAGVWLWARRAGRAGGAVAQDDAEQAGTGQRELRLEGARVTLGPDTEFHLGRSADGGAEITLRRGMVRCEVQPSAHRRPFRVRAGQVEVVVLGTRFAVWRDGAEALVTVERGRVAVIGPDGPRELGAGELGRFAAGAEDPGPRAPAAASAASEVPEPPGRDEAAARQRAFRAAQEVEAAHPEEAARAFRGLADGGDVWARLALFELAELRRRQRAWDAALVALDEYLRRFGDGPQAQDAAWMRAEVLQGAGRLGEAMRAARAYLERHPDGAYADSARRLLRGR